MYLNVEGKFTFWNPASNISDGVPPKFEFPIVQLTILPLKWHHEQGDTTPNRGKGTAGAGLV